jgi:hypothetical protein
MFYGKFQNSQISMRSSSRWAKNIEEILIFFGKTFATSGL